MRITLIYFDFPFWRAEISRIALFIGAIDFQDLRINYEEFGRVKSNGHLDNGTNIPFHQLPCLVVDNISIAQSAGIARYCGKLSGLYPVNNAIKAAQIDQFLDILTDITEIISSTKPEDREEVSKGPLTRKLTILNKNIDLNKEYLVDNTLSIADIGIWSFMGWLIGGKLDGISLDILKEHENIKKVCRLVDQHPKVNDWIKKAYPKNYSRTIF